MFLATHQLSRYIQLVMFYLHGRYSHTLTGRAINELVFLYPVGLCASRLGCKLGVRLLLTQADAALHMFVSPLAPQGNMQYKREYHICDLRGAAVGRFVHFHCNGQHPLEQEHHPRLKTQSALRDTTPRLAK